jgi:hypothetical protein
MPKRTRRSPEPTVPENADQLPVTRAMLMGVRTEVIERITAVDERLGGAIEHVETKLTGEIARVESKLTGEIVRVEARLSAQYHDLKADVARLGVLIEEQNARNSVVFEALHGVIEHHKRTDRRLDDVETTLHSLASGQRSR